jgi:cytochrome c oxidase subunit II
LRSHEGNRRTREQARRFAVIMLAASSALLATGCTSDVKRGWLPAASEGATNQTKLITDFWVGSWVAALVVGVLVWALTIWCMVAYRRRREETGLPLQIRYNLPMEILYTVIPMVMVAGLFYYTARDEAKIVATTAKPDVNINVVGKQWAWDFNYLDAKVYDSSAQVELNGKPVPENQIPTLYLPVGKRVQFTLNARDVIHSFWIPAFLYKLDMLPGVTNKFQVVPERVGTFKGKCAELCGEYHSEMLFNVKVVPQADYDAHLQELRDRGQVGELNVDLGRSDLAPTSSGSK